MSKPSVHVQRTNPTIEQVHYFHMKGLGVDGETADELIFIPHEHAVDVDMVGYVQGQGGFGARATISMGWDSLAELIDGLSVLLKENAR